MTSNLGRRDPKRYFAHEQWQLVCIECGAHCALSTEEMEAQIRRGEVITPATDERRFKCPHCGKIGLVSPRRENLLGQPAGSALEEGNDNARTTR